MRKKEWKLLSCSKRGAEENSPQPLGGAFSEPESACGLKRGKPHHRGGALGYLWRW